MSFTLNQITQRAGGGDIIRTKNIITAEPVIGRGADCDIQLLDLAVSLRHAVLRQTVRDEVEIEAIGQNTFEVNDVFENHVRVRPSDRPKLIFGDHELVLSRGKAADEVIVTVSKRAETLEQVEAGDERKVFSLSTSMFSRRLAAWTLIFAVLMLCLAAPVAYFYLTRNKPVAANAPRRPDVQWESAALSPGHRFLENNCQACHQKAFVSVRDEACVACHKPELDKLAFQQLAALMRSEGSPFTASLARDHAPAARMLKAQPTTDSLGHRINAVIARTFNHPEGRCTSCHTEHVDSASAKTKNAPPQVGAHEVVETDCADCHRTLTTRLPDTPLLNVGDWSNHPDFRPLVTIDPKGPVLQRIALTERSTENNGLIFPHRLHLSKTGGVARMAQTLGKAHGYGAALDCADCHRPDGGGFKPIEMVRDCSSCHSLAFAREGGAVMMLPHGDPGKVVATLKTFYAANASADLGDLFRRRPGSGRAPMPPSRGLVAQGVRAVFSKGGACYGCHTVVAPSDPKSLNYTVAAVRLTNRYLPRGGFDHSVPAHRMDASGAPTCNACHKAQSSDRSADLLLPPILKCGACHGQPKLLTPNAASDSCTECHGYHNPGTPALYMPAAWDLRP